MKTHVLMIKLANWAWAACDLPCTQKFLSCSEFRVYEGRSHRLLVVLLVCFILLGRLTGRKTTTVNSLYTGHCGHFELVSSLARVYFCQTSVRGGPFDFWWGGCRIFRLLDIFFLLLQPCRIFFWSPCPCMIFFLLEISNTNFEV